MAPVFGCHISSSKGALIKNIADALSKGAHVVQIFAGSPLSRMTEKTLQEKLKVAPEIKEFITKNKVKIFIHAPYTLNFAKDAKTEEPYWNKALFNELCIAEAMGAEGCVIHMGKATSKSVDEAEKNMYANISVVVKQLEEAKMNVKIFVETSAGQGSELYATKDNTLVPLANFWSQFTSRQRKHLGLCVDTCHIYAAGYDIGNKDQITAFFKEFDKLIGLEYLNIVHMNNSVGPLGCCVDRHACLEHGNIPFEALAAMISECYARSIPIVLETPSAIQEVPILQKMAKQLSKN